MVTQNEAYLASRPVSVERRVKSSIKELGASEKGLTPSLGAVELCGEAVERKRCGHGVRAPVDDADRGGSNTRLWLGEDMT